jgi:Pyruvate/2-oxoacid:ferredoxin oxidoreductase delta subunit
MPFVVGIYEEALPRMDEELARLFEEYYQETKGGSVTHGGPAVQRVIPVGESIPVNLEIFPHERASEYIENAKAWGVRDCICRVQQKLVGKGCDHPVGNCLVFAPVEGVFDGSEVTRPITKEESLRILREAADTGLVHSAMNQKGQVHYICNCCTCCCGILRGVAEFGIPTAVARSDFRVAVDAEECAACGACIKRCHFGALEVVDDVCVVDYDRCVGCGACVSFCSFDAMTMERRPEGEIPETPANRRAWLAERAEARGISLADIE